MKSSSVLSLAALSSIAHGLGITYSPYHDDMSCKSQDEVNADFARIYADQAYTMIRIYGTDCSQTALVLNAIRDNGSQSKLFAGIDTLDDVTTEANNIIKDVAGDWSLVDTVSVSNEGIEMHGYTVQQISDAVGQVKSQLSDAGFGGSVVTVEQFATYFSMTNLCNVGDYVAANCHPFFDPNAPAADGAASFVTTQYGNLQNTCQGKTVVITESGWPSAGDPNGNAVPSPANQATAITGLKDSGLDALYLFTAFNDYWKVPGQYNVEQHWGFLGDSASTPPPSKKRALSWWA